MASSAVTAPHRWATLCAMCVAQGMVQLDTTIVNVALPAIQRALGVTPANLEWTISAYVLALAALIVTGGTLGDRFGRRRVFLVGLAVFTMGSAACALARDDPQLILFRALQGAGAALMVPLTLSILVDAFPPAERPTAIGIWASVSGIGFGAGPIVGGLLIARLDWSAVFWVNVPIGIVAALLTFASVRESRDPGAGALDPVGTVLVTAALFLVTFALIETNAHPWLSVYTLSLFAGAALALAAFVVHERRREHPMVPSELVLSGPFRAACLVYALAYFALAGTFFFATLYFQNVRGWSALRTGLSWIPLNLPFLAVAPLAGRIGRRFGTGPTSAVGLLAGALGIAALARLDVDSPYLAAWPAYLLIGLGYGLAVPAVSAAAMGSIPAARAGVASGILNASRQVGAAIGLAVLGSLSVAVAGGAWRARVSSLPSDVQGRAETLVQQVAGAEGQAIGALIGQEAVAPAYASFVVGLEVALLVGAAAMLAATVIAVTGLRVAPAVSPPAAPAKR